METLRDGGEPFKLVGGSAFIMSQQAVTQRLRRRPSPTGFWRDHPDCPRPIMTRRGKPYWDRDEIEQFASVLGV
jgi:hypothetical protein